MTLREIDAFALKVDAERDEGLISANLHKRYIADLEKELQARGWTWSDVAALRERDRQEQLRRARPPAPQLPLFSAQLD